MDSTDSSKEDSLLEWMSPRVSFSDSFPQLDDAHVRKTDDSSFSTDFEFSMSFSSVHDCLFGGSGSAMLPADELFSNGKLLPLQPSPQLQTMTTGNVQASLAATKYEKQSPPPPLVQLQQLRHSSLVGQDAVCVLRDLGHPTSAFCSSPQTQPQPQPQRGANIAPPSPETPRCSILLRDLFGAKKAQVNGSNRAITTSKAWKLLVGGSTRAEKKAPKIPSFSMSMSSPASAVSQSISSQTLTHTALDLHKRNEQLYRACRNRNDHDNPHQYFMQDIKSVESLLTTQGFISRHAYLEVEGESKKTSGCSRRSISMPSTRWCSPERAQLRNNDSQKPAATEKELSSIMNSRRVQSGRISMKNSERCRVNHKNSGKLQVEADAVKHLAYWKTPEKVSSSYGSSVRVAPVLNVPATSLTPSIRTGRSSKSKLERIRELFSLKKENHPTKCSLLSADTIAN